MLGGDHDKLHACLFGQLDHRLRVPLVRIKLAGQLLVILLRDGGVTLDLLAVTLSDALAIPHARRDCIEAPVNKHAELAILPCLNGGSARPRIRLGKSQKGASEKQYRRTNHSDRQLQWRISLAIAASSGSHTALPSYAIAGPYPRDHIRRLNDFGR